MGIGGETDADDDTARADVLGSLLEGLLGHGDEDDSRRTETVGGGSLDLSNEVARGLEIDKGSSTELGAHVALLVAAVDGNGVQTHGLGVLDGEGAETTTGTDNGDVLAGLGTGLLKSLVDGDTGAENGRDGLEIALLGDAGNVGSLGDGVLLEGTVDSVTREESVTAEGLVRALAVRALEAGSVDPFDTGVVADLDILDERADSYDDTGTFVATDKGHLGGKRPVTVHGVEIGVADARVLDVDEDLIRAGLGNRDLLVDGRCECKLAYV